MRPRTAPRSWKKISDFLGILYIVTLMFTTVYGPQPLFAAIHADFAVSEASISLLVSAALLPLGVAPLFFGALLSSMPARRLLRTSMFLLMLTGLPVFFTESFPLLLACRLLQGLLVPAVLTSLMAHISSQYQGAELQRAMTFYIGTTVLGGLLGRLLNAAVAGCLGWRWSMLLASLAIGLGIAVVSGFPKETCSRFNKIHFKDFTQVLKDSILLRLLLFEAGGLFVFAAVGNCLPFYLNSLNAEISELRIAFMYSGYALGAVLAFCSHRISRFFKGETRAVLAALCVILITMPALLSADMLIIFTAMTVLCAAQFMQHSICPGLINRLCEKDRGIVNGLCLSFYYTGGALGSYLSVLMYMHFSWSICIALLAAILIAMIIMALSLKNLRPPAEKMPR